MRTAVQKELVFSAAMHEMGGMKSRLSLIAVLLCLSAATQAQGGDARSDFLKIINRPRVALSAQVDVRPATNGIVSCRFSFASDSEQRVPGLLMKPDTSQDRRPVVIALHGTGGSKRDMLSLCRRLAVQGFVAVAIDGRYHGERTKSGRGAAEYEQAIVRAWQDGKEHPFYYDTVWDVLRLIDYLTTRDDVDPSRIGVIGISKGGIEAYLAAAVDERIAVAVPCIAAQSFRWALDNNDWQGRIGTIQKAFDEIALGAGKTNADSAFVREFYDRMIPGIYSEFDGPAMLPLIAPRPLLIINSDTDKNTPLPGVLACIEATKPAYQAAQEEDRFLARIQEKTGHRVTPDSERAAIDWFVKWLKP